LTTDTSAAPRRARLRYAELKEVFDSTVDAFKQLRELPTLSAFSYDDEAPRSRIITPRAIDYAVDITNAVAYALRDAPELEAGFDALIDGQTVAADIAKAIVTRCGPVFADRGLTPQKYFEPMKIGRAIDKRPA